MKKTLLTNPVFRYIFEVFVIVFSVTISFYIQEKINTQNKIDDKNAGLNGVLSDLKKDENYFYGLQLGVERKMETVNKILKDKVMSNLQFNNLMRYNGFTGNNNNYKSMISTGSVEYISNKELFEKINNFYSWNYNVMSDQAKQDESLFWRFTHHIEENYLIDSITSDKESTLYQKFHINKITLEKIINDPQITSQLNTRQFIYNIIKFFAEDSLRKIDELKVLIQEELK
jgi:hypothetical protein